MAFNDIRRNADIGLIGLISQMWPLLVRFHGTAASPISLIWSTLGHFRLDLTNATNLLHSGKYCYGLRNKRHIIFS